MPKATKNDTKFDPKAMKMMTGSALGGLWGAGRLQGRLQDRSVNDFFNVISDFGRFLDPIGSRMAYRLGSKVDILTSKIDICRSGRAFQKKREHFIETWLENESLGVPNA